MFNRNYGRIVDGVFSYAPRPIKDGTCHIFTNNKAIYASFGYLPVVIADRPDCPEGYYLKLVWSENAEYVQGSWEIVPIESESEA